MSRLLAVLLLTFGSASALAAPTTTFDEWREDTENGLVTEPPALETAEAVEGVIGGNFYVVDPTQPVEFTFVTSHAGHDLILSVASLDDAGNIIGEATVFSKIGSSYQTEAYRNTSTLNLFEYDAEGARLVLHLYDKTTNTYYVSNAVHPSDGKYHTVAYYDYYNGQTLVGFEDLLTSQNSDWDYDDIVFLVSNVRQVSHAPEPEAYLMLLVGLGLVGAVARRRRERI
ncbi:MAG: DUF4114 domain-containing protein [Azoarcus sp.]|jgi:hypothetical protein|nr:DUF4114 domain-containing protein [Azoarcus sp.]